MDLAVNEITCERLVETGELIRIPDTQSGPGFATSAPEGDGASDSVASTLSTQEVLWHYYVIWQDPVFIQVTKVQQNLRWTFDGSRIISLISATDSRSWFTPSGWTETYHHKASYKDSNYTYVTTNDTFYNQPFCGGTYIFYSPMTLTGRRDGSATGSAYTSASGCGTNLLRSYSFLWMW
jgi:hypothetical protein